MGVKKTPPPALPPLTVLSGLENMDMKKVTKLMLLIQSITASMAISQGILAREFKEPSPKAEGQNVYFVDPTILTEAKVLQRESMDPESDLTLKKYLKAMDDLFSRVGVQVVGNVGHYKSQRVHNGMRMFHNQVIFYPRFPEVLTAVVNRFQALGGVVNGGGVVGGG